MYVIVAGVGEVGRNITRTLLAAGHDIVIVDKSAEALESAQRMDVLTVTGSAASPPVLAQAGVEKADLFYAVTDDDEANLLACAMAKARNPRCRTVARVNGLEYMTEPVTAEYQPIGCDVAVCPELVAARRIARILDIPSMVDADVFAEGKVQVIETRVHPRSKLARKRVRDIPFPDGLKLVAVFHEDELIVPSGADTLMPHDRLLVLVKDEKVLLDFHGLLGEGEALPARRIVRRVLVVGATRVGIHLARELRKSKEVTLIERDRARCEEVSEQLEGVLVLQGDAADRDTLEEEGVERSDAVIACEERDEFNIFTCLMAKQLGVPRAISLVRQIELKGVAERIGIDLAVSPRQASIGAFVRYAHEHVPEKMYVIAGGEAQVLEVEVRPGDRLAGVTMKKAGFPKNSIVGAIVRGKDVIVPGGDDTIMAGDRLIVFTLAEVAPKVHKLL